MILKYLAFSFISVIEDYHLLDITLFRGQARKACLTASSSSICPFGLVLHHHHQVKTKRAKQASKASKQNKQAKQARKLKSEKNKNQNGVELVVQTEEWERNNISKSHSQGPSRMSKTVSISLDPQQNNQASPSAKWIFTSYSSSSQHRKYCGASV